ncbi:putative thiosulfate sulfurtransferase [alpha proteobacterium BAL199]|jgi:thiosulfate/3-mercaptopyruvate sulfurtransferase|nr:putative thiosulfate sulfurtransferase [alpha proteobacterium BAL199]
MTGSSLITLPDSLVSTDWLAAHLGSPGLRVFDATCFLLPDPKTTLRAESGRPAYEAAHIPGAAFLDITGDEFSDPAGAFRFTMPKPQRLADAFGAHGIGDDTAVVLYAVDNPSWATRFWWMLRVAGFDNAAVLDGGLKKWQAEGRPVETGTARYPSASMTARPRPHLVVGRDGVLEALGGGACVINALSPEQHRGDGTHYGRPGRIAGSGNVASRDLLDPATNAFKPQAEIAGMMRGSGALDAERVVPYCGGGIAASVTTFWLTRLGHTNVALYDNSLSEWVTDPSLPMETG